MAYQKLSKTEKNKRTKERLKRESSYRVDYQKEKYKFVNVQFRTDDEKDNFILNYLESEQQKGNSRATTIKNILYEYITENKKED